MIARTALVAVAAQLFAATFPQQSPPPAPHDTTGIVHLLDQIPEPALSTLHSPALSPPDVGEIAPKLAELELSGTHPDGRAIYLLPLPVDRSALDSLRLEPAGAKPQLVAGSRFVSADRLAAFQKLKQRVTPDGRRAFCVDRPTELKLPIDRAGPSARLTLAGGPFTREQLAGVTLTIDGRVLHPRAASGAAALALAFDLPDALGLTMALVSIGHAGPGPDELLLSGYQLDEEDGRDRALVAAGLDPQATRLRWRPAPPAPLLPLPSDSTHPTSCDVLLLPGRVGLSGVEPGRVDVESAEGPIRFEPMGGDTLVADVAIAKLARFTLGPAGGERQRAPLLLQPRAALLRHFPPMRGEGVAEPVHPLVDHWQLGEVTRRALSLAAGSEWRIALPAGATRLEFELATLELARVPPGTPAARLVASVSAGGDETEIGAVALPPAARADVPDRFDAIVWPIAAAATPASRQLRLRVEPSPAAPFTSQLRTALIAEPRVVVAGPAAAPHRYRNLLVYLVDTLRADRVHCLGNARETSPNVDALARDGILFTNGNSQAPWTRPSVATLFTGLIPEHHTVTFETALPRAAATLAEAMRASGRETAAFTANVQVHASGLDFEQGFDRFAGFPYSDHMARSDEVVDEALPWLDAHADRPFFLYVHTIDPHDPYDPPPITRGRFEREYHGRIDDAHASVGELSRLLPLGEDDRNHILDLYDEEIAFADLEFGVLIDHLKQLGLYEETVILFLSDHGEELLDHGKLGHPRRLWNEVLHVPMVLRIPGAGAPRGRVVDELVRTMDWLPTLSTLFDLPPPEHGYEGVDLSAAWSEAGLPDLDAIAQTEPNLESFRHGNFKVILELAGRGDEATAHLFDLSSDPHEQHDLAAERPEGITALRRGLAATKAEYVRRGFGPLDARRVTRFDPDVERALRQLGYAVDGK